MSCRTGQFKNSLCSFTDQSSFELAEVCLKSGPDVTGLFLGKLELRDWFGAYTPKNVLAEDSFHDNKNC